MNECERIATNLVTPIRIRNEIKRSDINRVWVNVQITLDVTCEVQIPSIGGDEDGSVDFGPVVVEPVCGEFGCTGVVGPDVGFGGEIGGVVGV